MFWVQCVTGGDVIRNLTQKPDKLIASCIFFNVDYIGDVKWHQ
jgi:hypothetical protein